MYAERVQVFEHWAIVGQVVAVLDAVVVDVVFDAVENVDYSSFVVENEYNHVLNAA